MTVTINLGAQTALFHGPPLRSFVVTVFAACRLSGIGDGTIRVSEETDEELLRYLDSCVAFLVLPP